MAITMQIPLDIPDIYLVTAIKPYCCNLLDTQYLSQQIQPDLDGE